MKSLQPLMLLLATGAAFAAALPKEPKVGSVYSKCYMSTNAEGFYVLITNYVSDLRDIQYNNVIDSVAAKGVAPRYASPAVLVA
ncbi:uncharacterized protein [Panulirus ornatus]|uniref:uncharacterized protein isoform X2 n=1 Tax=Panulirus ornatus TaxID=150431 RepID=UPI003A86E48E